MTSTPSRWGEQKRINNPEAAREKIIAAAYECYEKKGINSTTFTDIAKASNISRRTIYHYFDNKKALIQAVVDDQASDFLNNLLEELAEFEGSLDELSYECLIYLITKGPNASGHQALLSGQQAAASGNFYLHSKLQHAKLKILLKPYFETAKQQKTISQDLSIDIYIQWLGRICLSFIEHPLPLEQLKPMLKQCAFPSLLK